AMHDEALARRLTEDMGEPERGVLPAGKADVEAPRGALLHELLPERGWSHEEPWTPLRRDLTEPVEDPGVRIEVTGPERAHVRTAVQRAAFGGSTFTDERWHAMAAGPAYADARCLVAYDDQGAAVAAATVWSAGRGRPGLLEPVGADPAHRGRGHGKAVIVAAAAALRDLGSSSAIVCTPSSNTVAIAAYRSAGFQPRPEIRDVHRAAWTGRGARRLHTGRSSPAPLTGRLRSRTGSGRPRAPVGAPPPTGSRLRSRRTAPRCPPEPGSRPSPGTRSPR